MSKNQLCYNLINNYNELEKFIDILPDEKHGDQYYITLFARKKYDTSGLLKCDKNCIKRITARKKDIIKKIEQLEVRVGCYTYDDCPIPEECLAVYVSPNPRSFHLAGVGLVKNLVSLLGEGRIDRNIYSLAMDHLQKSSEKKTYFDVDIDFLNPEDFDLFKAEISKFINLDALTFVQTRGGYHCLVNLDKLDQSFKKSWYMSFNNLKFRDISIMMNSDGLIPIPGTTAGERGYIRLID